MDFIRHHFLLILALAALVFGLRQYGITLRLIWADSQTRLSLVQAARVRRTWSRLARNLKLTLTEATPTPVLVLSSSGRSPRAKRSTVTVPKIRITVDQYGIRIRAKTLPGVGLVEFEKNAQHLSDAWRSVRVTIDRPEPGIVHIRAVRRDPLTEPLTYHHEALPSSLRTIVIGLDEYAEPVPMRLDGVAGIVINGLPGYGKTSLINLIILFLAVFDCVQFVVLDGKAGGDYDDIEQRCVLVIDDDIDKANQLLEKLVEFRRQRSATIRAKLGTNNMWSVGPSKEWPLVVIIIDEAHTYFTQVKDGGDKRLKELNAKAAQNAMHVQDLVKKGRSVGIVTMLATQKGTGDAIPTFIRDVCSVSISFAVRTEEAAIAALGSDIKNWPDAHPMALQDPAYIGVASMQVTGRKGFTRLRTPHVLDQVTAAVCHDTAPLALRSNGSDIGKAQLDGVGVAALES